MTISKPSRTSRVVFLSGPPGAGKSSCAAAVAARWRGDGADLDDLLHQSTGESPAALIKTRGEAAFRIQEHAALQNLDPKWDVVALGGGTLTQKSARSQIRARGVVVHLECDAHTIADRLERGRQEPDRPLLADGSVDAIRSLLDARQRTYATADRTVDATRSIADVAASIEEAVADIHLVRAEVGDMRSRVLVGARLQQSLLGAIAHLEPGRPIVVIQDEGIPDQVRRSWLAPLSALYPLIDIPGPGGEAMKSWSMLGEVLERALAGGAGRQSVVVGLGGGATCDLAGMTASLLGRGAPLILIPSTLLAQVDASVGGKAAVNAAAGRNLIGAFHAADEVLIDPELLDSLSPEERRSGLAELVKMAALFDAQLFDRVVSDGRTDATIIARAIELKADVVGRDPFEQNERRLLNFGHTLAHGIESASKYRWRHGDAVAVGMAAMLRWSAAEGWLAEQTKERILSGFRALSLPVGAPFDLLKQAVGFLGQDKKADDANITIVTLSDLAQPIQRKMSVASVQQAMVQHGGEQ
ncbi:MAG: bifunctional shikimate kinase/3-dehydroquinate synthase [Myxococcota bacterium]